MDTARYVVALIVLLSFPPGLLLWLAIHPFARFWRRFGPVWTYSALGVPTVLLMTGLFFARRTLLARDFGTNSLTIALALLTMLAGATVSIKRRRHLRFGILAGVPELSERRYPGRLLTDGIYGTLRHPRYVEVILWTLAYALFANYLTPYVVVLLSMPVMHIVVVLEERELRDRFGPEYDAYRARVPRFVPHRKRRP